MLLISLVACNFQTVDEYKQMQEKEKSVVEAPKDQKNLEQSDKDIKNNVKENVEDKKIEGKPITPALEQSKNNEKEKAANETIKKEVEKSTEKPVVKEEPKKTSEVVKPQQNSIKQETVAKPSGQPIEPKASKRYVTIGIYANTLLENWDMLDPALQSEKYVPSDGVILNATKYELLSEKETVWDVLLRATKEHNIQLEYQGANQNSFGSVYVEGINYLYEFSAGPLSGWIYKVNGVTPNYGASQYVLKEGDVIEWHYTVDLGRDQNAGTGS